MNTNVEIELNNKSYHKQFNYSKTVPYGETVANGCGTFDQQSQCYGA